MLVAATWYMIDQNEPSAPFLLNLPCSDDPTKEELLAAVSDYFGKNRQDDENESARVGGWEDERLIVAPVADLTSGYGDVRAFDKNDDSVCLFIGLPTDVAKKLGLRLVA